MALDLGALKFSITADGSQAKSELGNIDSAVQNTASKGESGFSKFAKGAATIGLGIAGAAATAVTGLASIVMKTSDVASEFQDLSTRTGMSAESLQEFAYGKAMGNGYYQLNGDYTKGKCAKWLGMYVADCSNFIQAVRRELGYKVGSASAQGQYAMCKVHGLIKDMPKQAGVAVFIYNPEAKKMSHVGMYIGNGIVLESAGVVSGIIKSKLSSRWTHYGKLDYLEYDVAPEGTVIQPKPIIYTVVKGDTLSKIGKKFGVSWLKIAKDNNIKVPYIIRVGQKITINK